MISNEMNNGVEVKSVPIFNIPFMCDEHWNELAKKQTAKHNPNITNNDMLAIKIINDWNCTALEAKIAIDYNCDSLESVQETIATAVTNKRLLVSLFSENLRYMRDVRYKNVDVSEDFINSEAWELTKENAHMFSFKWNQVDSYESMSTEEIIAAMYGN